jgi:hypothetical protein
MQGKYSFPNQQRKKIIKDISIWGKQPFQAIHKSKI